MKRFLVVLSIVGLAGCSSLPTLTFPTPSPTATPSATPTATAPLVQAGPFLQMVCASPAAKADPKISSACDIYTMLGGK